MPPVFKEGFYALPDNTGTSVTSHDLPSYFFSMMLSSTSDWEIARPINRSQKGVKPKASGFSPWPISRDRKATGTGIKN